MIIIQLVVLALIGMTIYLPVIISSSPSNPDAQFIWLILKSFHNLGEYFQALFSLGTLDVQPVRDLSLWMDMAIFEATGLNVLVFHNIILWVLFCYISALVLQKCFALTERTKLMLMVSFLVYPLFSQTVAWGMGRKHLLSVLFIQSGTLIWIQEKLSKRKSLLVCGLYLLSVLSQPISLLWPIWAIAYSKLIRPESFSSRIKVISLLSFFMVVLTGINFAYYQFSPTFLQLYGHKTNELFEFSDKILATGHYFFQIVFPYILGFRYYLGNWSTLAGLILLGLFCCILLGFKIDRKVAFVWLLYVFLPISIVVAKSSMLYDTYLLMPTFGVVALLILILKKLSLPRKAYVVWMVLIVFWAGSSFYNVQGWANEILLTERGFNRWPSCTSAYDYLKTSYENGKSLNSPEAKLYIYSPECKEVISNQLDLINMQAYTLYYEDDLSLDDRMSKLSQLAEHAIFPGIALAALNIQNKREGEANENIQRLINKYQNINYKEEYIPLVGTILYPYCQQHSREECLKFLKPFSVKKASIFYK